MDHGCSTHPVVFPSEIFTEIFRFLASEPRVLLACSQAHPIFARLIEPILYAHVIVHKYDAHPEDGHYLKLKPDQLSTLLSDNPRIINYLRSLCVDISQFDFDDEAMKESIPIFPGLKLERIQVSRTPTGLVRWEWFPRAFRTALVACISTSFMKEIRLDGTCNVPLSSFADCAGLKRLTLSYNAVPPSNMSCNFPHLEALELFDWNMDGHSQDFFSWALTHACGLRSLTLTTYRNHVICTFLPQFLASCSTLLVDLSIYYINSIHSDAASIEVDFPGLPNLKRLRLCTYTGMLENSDDYTVRCALLTITQILQSLSSLKHLTLVLCLRFRGRDVTQVDWSPLANFLSDRHSSFQHTDLYILVEKVGSEVSSDEVISMLSRYENLTSLVEAGYVSIKKEKYIDVHVNRFFQFYT